jgi:hypothetical protein
MAKGFIGRGEKAYKAQKTISGAENGLKESVQFQREEKLKKSTTTGAKDSKKTLRSSKLGSDGVDDAYGDV